MTMRIAPSSRSRFSYFPMPFTLFLPVLVPVFFLVLVVLGRVRSPSGYPSLFLYAILGLGGVLSVLFAASYWRRPWRYEIDETGFAADRVWGRQRIYVRWDEIIRVGRVRNKDWRRNWPENVVGSRRGIQILLPSNLGGYN